MDNSVYEVSRDEYVGFIDSIRPDARLTEKIEENGYTFIKVRSNTTDVHFCTRVIPPEDSEEKETYFIFNMPQDDERREGRGRVKIELTTKEEVQAFFDFLKSLQEKK